MNQSITIFSLIFILVSLSLKAQVEGRIVDAENSKPITYAHIYLRASGEGTASNIGGYFRLAIPDKRDTLQITCVGYEPFILPLSRSRQVPSVIRLVSSSTMLDEVVVNASGPDAEEIMRKAIEKSIINYGYDDYNMKMFMRTTMQRDGEFVHLTEADGWVYEGGAPAWKVSYDTQIGFLQFTVQNEVRLSDQKYLLERQVFTPADLNSDMLIWEANDYNYELESVQPSGKNDALYTIRAKPAKKFKLKRKPSMNLQGFFAMERIFIVRAKDFAVLEVKMGESYPKKRDGERTSYSFDNKTNYMDSVHFMIQYDITPSGLYRPYYMHRYYEYTDTGLEDYSISPLQLTEKYEMFFSAYDTSDTAIEDLKRRYWSYGPYERTEVEVTLAYANDSTAKVVRPILSGSPSFFQLNRGYVVWGKPTYRPEYWARREKTLPPYKDKEKLFSDLAKLRPVAEQFADFTPRSEDFARRMLELYGDDPYIRRIMKKRIATMKSRYRRFFDPERDY